MAWEEFQQLAKTEEKGGSFGPDFVGRTVFGSTHETAGHGCGQTRGKEEKEEQGIGGQGTTGSRRLLIN
jgi:hypothetical protein